VAKAQWHLAVSKAREFVQGPTLVLMSDHLFSLPLLKAVQRHALGADEVALGVDFNITKCFDIDDATKVKLSGQPHHRY
jgi:hypothetical protein